MPINRKFVLDTLRDLIRIDSRNPGTVEPVLWRSPYEIDPNLPVVRTVAAAAADVRGEPAARTALPASVRSARSSVRRP